MGYSLCVGISSISEQTEIQTSNGGVTNKMWLHNISTNLVARQMVNMLTVCTAMEIIKINWNNKHFQIYGV